MGYKILLLIMLFNWDLTGRLNQFINNPFQSPTVKVETISGEPNTTVKVPIRLETTTIVNTLTLDLIYDQSKLTFINMDKTGALLKGFFLADANEYSPGKIRILGLALFTPPISTSGVLAYLNFSVHPDGYGPAEIQIAGVEDDLAGAVIINGAVMLPPKTAVNQWSWY